MRVFLSVLSILAVLAGATLNGVSARAWAPGLVPQTPSDFRKDEKTTIAAASTAQPGEKATPTKKEDQPPPILVWICGCILLLMLLGWVTLLWKNRDKIGHDTGPRGPRSSSGVRLDV